MHRTLASVASVAAIAAIAAAAHGDIIRTVDLGPVGPIDNDSDSEQDFLTPTVDVGGETLGRVEVRFADGKALTVRDLTFGPGTSWIGSGQMNEFGIAPGGVNWVADVTWGILDANGDTIASETRLSTTIGTLGSSFGLLAVPAEVPSNTRVHGFFFEFANGPVGPLPESATVGVGFVGRVDVVPPTIDTTGVMNDETSSYTEDSPTARTSRAKIAASKPMGMFTHEFEPLGDTTWNVTWSAPAGQFIEVTVPVGFDVFDLEFAFRADADAPEPVEFFAFADSTRIGLLPGSSALALSDPQFSLTGPGGNKATASMSVDQEDLVPGESYRFDSVTITTTVPAGFDVSMDAPVVEFELRGFARTAPGEDPGDPGQWVRLVTRTPGDINGDGIVDGADLGFVLGAWGSCGDGACPADLTGDGVVDGADLGLVLGGWSAP